MPRVRHAADVDVRALADIRAHYVLHTHATFATVPPTHEEVRSWMGRYAEGSPHQLLVAVEGEQVLGYAGTLPYRPTPAFAGTVEMSVYLAPDAQARGIGTLLYAELLTRSQQHGARTWLAGIALPNDASLAFHRRHGFVEVGTFVDYAHKWGRPISSTWMQRSG